MHHRYMRWDVTMKSERKLTYFHGGAEDNELVVTDKARLVPSVYIPSTPY